MLVRVLLGLRVLLVYGMLVFVHAIGGADDDVAWRGQAAAVAAAAAWTCFILNICMAEIVCAIERRIGVRSRHDRLSGGLPCGCRQLFVTQFAPEAFWWRVRIQRTNGQRRRQNERGDALRRTNVLS